MENRDCPKGYGSSVSIVCSECKFVDTDKKQEQCMAMLEEQDKHCPWRVKSDIVDGKQKMKKVEYLRNF